MPSPARASATISTPTAVFAGTVANMTITLTIINSLLIFAVGGLSLWLWSSGAITVGAIALATSLVIRLNQMSGWILRTITGLFESVGTVQNGMQTISRPHAVVDAPDAKPLVVTQGEIRFEDVRFHYGAGRAASSTTCRSTVSPARRSGLVGRSGAGKSTLVNLLLRFYDLEGGRILIDGQDIAGVTQESLRAAIGMVTQDTSLLHRSVRDNIRYGRPRGQRGGDRRGGERRREADGFIAGAPRPQRPHRLRRPCRRARRQALRRPAPARRHRPPASSRTRRSSSSTRRPARSTRRSRRRSRSSSTA